MLIEMRERPIKRTISLKKIESLEKKYKMKLPEIYKSFLLKYNGGSPEPDSFYCDEDHGYNISDRQYREEGFGILFFFSLSEIKLYKDDYRVPKEFLAIAFDLGYSSYILLCIDKDFYGKIYFWGYGDYMVANDQYSNIYHVADSFEQLLDGLEECRD